MEGSGLELMLFLAVCSSSREEPASLVMDRVGGGRPGGETPGERTTERGLGRQKGPEEV